MRYFKPTVMLISGLAITMSFCNVNAVDLTLERIGISNPEPQSPPGKFSSSVIDKARAKLALADAETRQQIRNQLCDQEPTDQLCSRIPNDNVDFSELFVYMFILASAQNSFDVFSWQSFVAMNWPSTSDGQPLQTKIGGAPDAPRQWLSYRTPRQIFDPEYRDPVCADHENQDLPVLSTSVWRQTGGLPLIDSNLNYVVYDVRVNDRLADYIIDNGLDSVAGQQQYAKSGKPIDFPLGFYNDPLTRSGGKKASAALKTAWKIIDIQAGDDPSRYYTIDGLISIEASDSESGKAMCVQAELGLVGMHIMQRTKSGNGRDWTWSTFEHIDNAPFAANARKPIDVLSNDLFPGGCQSPPDTNKPYAFFNASCKDCKTNQVIGSNWKWSIDKPYASSQATDGRYGTQVVRCWNVFEGTQLINKVWQQQLQGTPWANYQSSSAQWKGARPNSLFPQGEVPRFLTNSSMETYDQYGRQSSCLSCHASARSAGGQDTQFSFLLSMAARYQSR